MQTKSLRILPALCAAMLLAACASDGGTGLFSTASVSPSEPETKVAAARPKIDPQCVTLASQIEAIRQEGSIERLEKVAAGKTANVQVKRAAIAKQAELNKANAEFQVKCAPRIPTEAAAPAAPATVAAAPAAAAAAKATAKAAATSGVTVVPSAPKVQ